MVKKEKVSENEYLYYLSQSEIEIIRELFNIADNTGNSQNSEEYIRLEDQF